MCVACPGHAVSTPPFEGGRLVRSGDDVLKGWTKTPSGRRRLKEAERGCGPRGQGRALTMGPEDAEDALMRALQMRALCAYIVSDEFLGVPTSSRRRPLLSVAMRRSLAILRPPSTWSSPAWPRWTQ